jgi:hypothetical protein
LEATSLKRLLPPNGNWARNFAIYVFVAAILENFFRWKITELLTPFLMPLMEMGIGLIFLLSLICSFVHLVRQRKNLPKSVYPLTVNIATFLIVWFVPLDWIATRADFKLHYAGRMAVVSDVVAGKYDGPGELTVTTRGDLINLPGAFSNLSAGGGMIMRRRSPARTLIFFYDFRGILDSFSGFVYSSDDSPPRDADFNAQFFQVVRLQKDWYWASSKN